MRVIVVGAGIGGLAATLVLRTLGFDAHVYEQAPALREIGAGISLASNALRALDTIGLSGGIRLQSITGAQGALRNPNGRVLIALPADELAKRIGIVAVMHRAELLALLAERIDPAWLHLNQCCIGIEQDRNKVTVRFHGGETLTADAVIGADGLRSSIRTQLFGSCSIRYAGYTAWRSVVEFNGSRNLVIEETWGCGCRFGIVPMSGGRVYWFATKNASEGQRDPEGQTKAVLLNQFRGWHEPIQALVEAAQEGSVLRNDIYDIDPLPGYTRGRVALLGDAAHAMTPNLGQGACQGIEDAVVLGACLKKHSSVESALQEYSRRRVPRTKQFVLQSRRLGEIAQLQNRGFCWARDAAMRMLPRRIAARQMKSMLDFELLEASERELFG